MHTEFSEMIMEKEKEEFALEVAKILQGASKERMALILASKVVERLYMGDMAMLEAMINQKNIRWILDCANL